MKKLCICFVAMTLSGCVMNSTPVNSTNPKPTSLAAIEHQLSAHSEVKVLDNEWSEYRNHDLDIAITFPRYSAMEPVYGQTTQILQATKVIENGEVISFVKEPKLDSTKSDESEIVPPVAEQAVIHTPYFLPTYLDDASFPYQVYLAKANNLAEVQAFVERAYGKSCKLSEPSGYTDRPDIQTFNLINKPGQKCANFYNVGDIMYWNTAKKAVIGMPIAWPNYFLKPYQVKSDQDPYYQLQIVGFNR